MRKTWAKHEVFLQLIIDVFSVINTDYYLNNFEKRKRGQLLGYKYQRSASVFKEVKWPDNLPAPSSGKIIRRLKNSRIAFQFNHAKGFLKKKCGMGGKTKYKPKKTTMNSFFFFLSLLKRTAVIYYCILSSTLFLLGIDKFPPS